MNVVSEADRTDPNGQGDAFNTDCTGRPVLDHVASRWGVLILTALDGPPLRFHVLRDRISGISEKMLSQNLRLLTRDGLIARTVEPTLPPRVSYELTPIGRGIAAHTRKLIDCIGRYAEDIAEAQRRYDLEADRR